MISVDMTTLNNSEPTNGSNLTPEIAVLNGNAHYSLSDLCNYILSNK